jgi:16S rRNA C1402 N4-methylase RsmH
MSLPDLTPEQAAEADRLFQHLRPVVEAELRQLTRLLASKADDKLLGGAEFEVRDRVHTIGARAIEAALNERKKGATKVPV